MRLRIRTAVCCTAIFFAVSFFTITFAETNPLSKAQVADQIRKVENGVDDFEKYLTSRGENAKDQAGSAKSSGEAKRGTGCKVREERSREGKSQPRKRRPSECHGRSESVHKPSAAQVRFNVELSGDQSTNGAGPGQRAQGESGGGEGG